MVTLATKGLKQNGVCFFMRGLSAGMHIKERTAGWYKQEASAAMTVYLLTYLSINY